MAAALTVNFIWASLFLMELCWEVSAPPCITDAELFCIPGALMKMKICGIPIGTKN